MSKSLNHFLCCPNDADALTICTYLFRINEIVNRNLKVRNPWLPPQPVGNPVDLMQSGVIELRLIFFNLSDKRHSMIFTQAISQSLRSFEMTISGRAFLLLEQIRGTGRRDRKGSRTDIPVCFSERIKCNQE